MKKFTFLAFTAIFLFTFTKSFSQIKPGTIIGNGERLRCATMEGLEKFFQENPEARAIAERNKNLFATENPQTQRTNVITTIPVVVHIVGSSARQAIVTDADVIWQINKLNEDFGGTNADSTNGTNFYGVRGHSELRFCLAQQDPNGNPTNGIDRVVSSITDACSDYEVLKHSSSCGADAWNTNQYFNIWVGEVGNCLLGVAQFPGTGDPTEDGIVLAFEGFSNNPAYVAPAFALGRTAVHEAGHYFGLYHIWGDESACTTSDFRQMPGTCLLPGSLAGSSTDNSFGDTPNQAGSTSGCLSGTVTDACSPSAPGKMYQNYMDYTDDACYSMFTNMQVDRMQWVVDNCRAGLKTSNGCVPVAAFALDAGVKAILSPGAGSCAVSGGSTTVCPSTSITPIVEIKNYGTTTLTSLQVFTQLGASPATSTNWTGSIPAFSSAIVTLPAIIAPATPGIYTLKAYTNNPNGSADQKPVNDTSTVDINVGAGQPLPVSESFAGSTFPPAGWRIINPDNGITWVRTAFSGAFSSPASMGINYYSYSAVGQKDIFASPALDVSGPLDSLQVSFQVSHAGYSSTFGPDSLELVYSPDCGNTWLNFGGYKKWSNGPAGSNLSTVPNTTASYAPTGPAAWRKETVTIKPNFPGNPSFILIGFRGTTGFGNNLFVDDINIDKIVLPPVDAGVTAISKPNPRECTSTVSPVVTVKNFGSETITTLKLNYQVDGGAITTVSWTGSLVPGASTNVTLNNVGIGGAGAHTFKAFTSLPNNANPDGNALNDALSKSYSVYTVTTMPASITEPFSGTFPPSGWEIVNPNNDVTWQKNSSYGKNAVGSAWVHNWNNTTFNRYDDIALPNFSYSGIDSIFLTFNVAAATYTQPGNTGVSLDTFAVLLSKDCGNTFTPVYKKWGEDLQTINNPNFPFTSEFFPKSNQWRKDSINLGKWLGSSENQFMISFRFSGNFENNLFLDDINLYSEILPNKLKAQGYMILPNPFHNQFSVWHYQTPTTLKYVTVYNAAGEQVWKKQFSGDAQRLITIDLTGRPAGTYVVYVGYDDPGRDVQQKVIKY
ncbi:MAG: T9SS type A sorting domain-containing protein [Terrimonas sp.]|nr:T9SS type A sorting domain-containing protein [Terrimonas sp.]